MTIDSIEFFVKDQSVHKVDLENASLTEVKSLKTGEYHFDFTYDNVGAMELTAIVNVTLNGASKQYKEVLKLTYLPEKW